MFSKSKLLKLTFLLLFLLLVGLFVNDLSSRYSVNYGSHTTFSTKITNVQDIDCQTEFIVDQEYGCRAIEFTYKGKSSSLEVFSGKVQLTDTESLKSGDRILVNYIDETDSFVFVGRDRVPTYYFLFAIFILITTAIAGKRGFNATISLLFSILVIGYIIIPLIIQGYNPILVATVVGFFMFSIQIYNTNGLNRQSSIAILGSLFGIVSAYILAISSSKLLGLSGFGEETSTMLGISSENSINIKDLLVASFIFGVLGVVDDASVSQVTTVGQLLKRSKVKDRKEIFKSAMEVGSSHIGSLMNTLFLAYIAVSLPLATLFFLSSSENMYETLSLEIFAEEIARTLVGSVGLILSIPATTYLASRYLKKEDVAKGMHNHSH